MSVRLSVRAKADVPLLRTALAAHVLNDGPSAKTRRVIVQRVPTWTA